VIPLIYSARYHIDIGPHVFPTEKYRLVYQTVTASALATELSVVEPEAATWHDLAHVHTPQYLGAIRNGTLSAEELAQLELPWSPAAVDGFQRMVGGTIDAALRACALTAESADHARAAIHIGGGLHHAFPNHGEGFCPFNDVAVAVRVLQAAGLERVAIIDLDVHHGNGTAFIFESDARVTTFSMHQQFNYPMWKPRGSLDIGLPDGTDDETYLRRLQDALPEVLSNMPDCVFYLAGADPYEDDQLGGLRLTRAGLRERDRLVVSTVHAAGLPLVLTLAGGYARRVADTVAIHVASIEEVVHEYSSVR
jgi:acetoin utilization deacetylase AcuC-like enzyme